MFYDIEEIERRAMNDPIVRRSKDNLEQARQFKKLLDAYKTMHLFDRGVSVEEFIDDFIESFRLEKERNSGIAKSQYLSSYLDELSSSNDEAGLDLDQAVDAFKRFCACK